MQKAVTSLLIMIVVLALLFHALGQKINQQDTMLCESAKVSGNREYLKKCRCYYEGRDISCLNDSLTK